MSLFNIFLEEEFSVGQNKLIGTIPIMYKDWIVSLDIKPLSRTYGEGLQSNRE